MKKKESYLNESRTSHNSECCFLWESSGQLLCILPEGHFGKEIWRSQVQLRLWKIKTTATPYISDAQCQRRRGGWSFLFPLSAYYKALYPSLRLCSEVYCIAVVVCWCVSFDNCHQVACLLPSLTTEHYILFWFYVSQLLRILLWRKVGGRGIYTDYIIVSKEMTSGIASLNTITQNFLRGILGLGYANTGKS